MFIYSWQRWELKAERCVCWANTVPLCKQKAAELHRLLPAAGASCFCFRLSGILGLHEWQGRSEAEGMEAQCG